MTFAWTENPRRSLILFAAGAAIGLVIAGFGLFTAKGTALRVVPPEDVATVNGKPILRSDFDNQLEAEYAVPLTQISAAERRATLADMIREELFVQRGLDLDMPASDPDTRAALVAAVEQQVQASVTAQTPTRDQLRAYYTAHADRYASEGTMTLTDLVTGPSGPPHDSGKVNGEEFYFAARIHLGERLFAIARGLADGARSPPIAQPDGTHVLVMIHNNPPQAQAFEEAEARVRTDYDKDLRGRMTAGELKYLKARADILIAPDQR